MLFKRKYIGRIHCAAALLFAAPVFTLQSGAMANTVLTIQAENATQTTGSGWSTESQLGGFTGSGYIVWRGANDFRATDAQPPMGIKAYDFQVTQAGTYEFVARVQARVGNGSDANDADNDAWVKFSSGSATQGVRGDANKWTKFFVSGADESWKNYSNGEQFDPKFFTQVMRDLPVGTHRVLIGGRSARFAIDSVGLELVGSGDVVTEPSPVTTPVSNPVSAPTGGSSDACVATGSNVTIARANYANSCPGIPRQDCDPLSNGSWICSSENINGNADALAVPTTPPAPATPVDPVDPVQPSEPVANGACSASGSNLQQAKNNYANACPSLPREDCDPLSSGGWICSSENIGSTSSAPVMTDPADSTDSNDTNDSTDTTDAPSTPVTATSCTASGSSLDQAKQNYANSCAPLPRQDCDPVNGGGWTCSSGVIGGSAPGGVSVASNPTTEVETPSSSDGDGNGDSADNSDSTDSGNNGGGIGLLGANDLLSLHYDNCPDRDDGHAVVAGKAVLDSAGVQNLLVVNGTCGAAIRNRYQPGSVSVLRAVWGNNWLDYFNDETQTINTVADRWAATLANGDDVWVAEGGPSDFTANVLRRLDSIYPSIDRKRVRVVQHSAGPNGWNEQNTLSANINLVKQVADYIEIPDGNARNNGTADFNQKSSSFVTIARQSRYANEWNAAFDYLSPDTKLDFSDTVEILHIIDDTQTLTVDDFADRYLR